jgi:hypothetical protein
MLKLVLVAALIGLLAACAGLSTNGYSTSASSSAAGDPPRSPGEGPSFNPVYP